VLQAIAILAVGWRRGITLGVLDAVRLVGDPTTPPLQLVEEGGHGRQCCGFGMLSALRAWVTSVGYRVESGRRVIRGEWVAGCAKGNSLTDYVGKSKRVRPGDAGVQVSAQAELC
jgi:hypothetical protein